MEGGLGLNRLIRTYIPELVIDCFDVVLFTTIGVALFFKLLPLYMMWKSRQRMRAKWSTSPKDVVILHTMPRGLIAPNISPFTMKLETFLRMAKIPYQFDGEFPFGPKAKTPWITLNGKHMGDSQLIIEHLTKKFDVKLGNYTDEQKAVGKTVRIMVDESLYWGGVAWRFQYLDPKELKETYSRNFRKFGWPLRELMWRMAVKKMRGFAYAQGIGRHSYDEVMTMMKDNMTSLAHILGNKKFLLGDVPTEEDASVFGFLSLGIYATPGSPLNEVYEKFPNLVAYTQRMRNLFWSDWDDLLAKPDS